MSTMNVTPEQIQAGAKASVDAIISVATTHFAMAEKIGNLQAMAIKSAFEDTIANARALAAAKDVQEYVNLQSSFAQPAIEKAIAYSRGVYEVVTQANADLAKLTERRVADWNQGFVSLLDKAVMNAPAGTEVAVTALKQMIAAGSTAYDNLTKATRQATEIAEANVAAATESVKGLVSKTRKAA
jgi:phasin family protein